MNSECIICGSVTDLEMHHVKHIRKASEMTKRDYWSQAMSNMNRKQIPVCKSCHNSIHRGEYDQIALKQFGPQKN